MMRAYLRARRISVVPVATYQWMVRSKALRPSITHTRSDIRNVLDRIAVNQRIDALLAEEDGADIKPWKDRKFLRHDLKMYLQELWKRDEAYRRTFAEVVSRYLATLSDDVLAEEAVPLRVALWLLRHGDVEGAISAYGFVLGRGRVASELVRDRGRVYWTSRHLDSDEGRRWLDVTDLGLDRVPPAVMHLYNELAIGQAHGDRLEVREPSSTNSGDPEFGPRPAATSSSDEAGRAAGPVPGSPTSSATAPPSGSNASPGPRQPPRPWGCGRRRCSTSTSRPRGRPVRQPGPRHPRRRCRGVGGRRAGALVGELRFPTAPARTCRPAHAQHGRGCAVGDAVGFLRRRRPCEWRRRATGRRVRPRRSRRTTRRASDCRSEAPPWSSRRSRGAVLRQPSSDLRGTARDAPGLDVVWSHSPGAASGFPSAPRWRAGEQWPTHKAPGDGRLLGRQLRACPGLPPRAETNVRPDLARHASEDALLRHPGPELPAQEQDDWQEFLDRWDYVVVPNRLTMRDTFMWSSNTAPCQSGPVCRRNDALVTRNDSATIEDLKRQLGLPTDRRIVIYAPTYCPAPVSRLPVPRPRRARRGLGEDHFLPLRQHYYRRAMRVLRRCRGSPGTCRSSTRCRSPLVSDVLLTDYSSSRSTTPSFGGRWSSTPGPGGVHARRAPHLRGAGPDRSGAAGSDPEEIVDAVRGHPDVPEAYAKEYEAFSQRFSRGRHGRAAERVVETVSGPAGVRAEARGEPTRRRPPRRRRGGREQRRCGRIPGTTRAPACPRA